MSPRLLVSVLALLAISACRPQITYDYAKEPDPRKTGFVIGVNDVLSIDVWKNQDLSGRHHVRPDGNITMPIIGDVAAAGLTPLRPWRAALVAALAAASDGGVAPDRPLPSTR